MTTCTYASYLERSPISGFTLTAISGGLVTISTNLYYFVYAITRGGINLSQSLGQVSVASGQKLRLTVNNLARPNGFSPFGFALGASTTNSDVNAKLLGVCWVKETDQVTDKALPLNFELTKNQDFVLGGTVATVGDLPTNNPVDGMIRYVTSESAFYQYDAVGFYSDSLIVDWRKVYGWDLYLADTTTLRSGTKWKGGQDVPINRFDITNDQTSDYYGIISPVWGGDGEESPPIKIWLTNGLTEGSGEVIESGSKLSVVAKINDNSELGSAIISDNLILTFTGIIQRSFGVTVTLTDSLVWVPGNFVYVLQSDLNPGYAIEASYTTTASVGDGDRVSIYLKNDGKYGSPSTNAALGSCIYADDDRCRIVPNTLGITRLSGKGIIATDGQLGGFEFAANSNSNLTFGIEPDSAGQKVGISGIQNGEIACYQESDDLPATSALRAIISTESGTATASNWSSPVTVGNNGRIEFTVNLPSAIRSDYPDNRIAGNNQGSRSIPEFRVFLLTSSIIREFPSVTVEADNAQSIIISSLSDATIVSSLPSNSEPSFNLWGYGSITGNASGVGFLPAGSYQLAVAAHYPSPNLSVTKISHDPNDGCIPELEYSFVEAIELSSYFSLVQLNGVAQSQRQILNFDSRLFQIEDDPASDRLKLKLPDVGKIIISTNSPTVNDDVGDGYKIGDRWFRTNTNPVSSWDLVNATLGAAVWLPSGSGGSGSGITAVATLADLVAITGQSNDATYLLKTNSVSGLSNYIYRYDQASTATSNDISVIAPTSGVGRWLIVGQQGATGPGYGGTSTTSHTISTGDKTFTTSSGLAYQSGNRVRVANSATDYLEGVVSDYSSTSLVVAVDRAVGSGTYTSWTIGLTGDLGATGDTGNTGDTGATGPGYGGTSTTSHTISTGDKTFTTSSGLAYQSGNRVRIANSATDYLEGIVSGYSSTSLVVAVDRAVGSGTYTSWTIGLTGDLGATGATGNTGDTGSVSSASTLRLVNQGTDPSTPSSGNTEFYSKSAGLFFKNDSGTVTQVIDSKQLLVSSGDTTQGYLQDKITANSGVSFTKQNSGSNENLRINIDHNAITNYSANQHIDLTAVNVETLSGTKTLTNATAYLQILNPNASNRNVVLGDQLIGKIVNNSAGTFSLDIKETSGGSTVLQLNSVTKYKAISFFRQPDNSYYIEIVGTY